MGVEAAADDASPSETMMESPLRTPRDESVVSEVAEGSIGLGGKPSRTVEMEERTADSEERVRQPVLWRARCSSTEVYVQSCLGVEMEVSSWILVLRVESVASAERDRVDAPAGPLSAGRLE